jgi:hypothetical protein
VTTMSPCCHNLALHVDHYPFTTLATYLIYILVLPVYLLIFLTLMF